MGPNPTNTTQHTPSILPKFFSTWDLQICSTSLIFFFSLIVLFVCFIYFDLAQFSSTLGGILLNTNIPTIRTISENLGRHENVNHLSDTIPAPQPHKIIVNKSPTITTNTTLGNQSTEFDHRVPGDYPTQFPNSVGQSIGNKTTSDNQSTYFEHGVSHNDPTSFLNDSIVRADTRPGPGKTRSIGGCGKSILEDDAYNWYLLVEWNDPIQDLEVLHPTK